MPTCPPNLRHSFLIVCKIIRFKVKKKVFFTVPKRDSSLSGAKKTIFGRRYGLLDFTFLFLVELGTCVQNLTYTRGVEHWENIYFPQGVAEIHKQWPFFDNKKSIWKILGLKIQTVKTCSSASSTRRNFYLWKTLRSRFLVVFQSFDFGQILANFGSFGKIADLGRFSCIYNCWEHAQTWAEIFKTP
jgi:hypothetical protein